MMARSPGLSLKGRALKYLSAREHSRVELVRKLAPHAADAAEIDQVLDDLEARGWLSAERFVESVVHRKAARYGAARIRGELIGHQLPDETVREALAVLKGTELERAQALWLSGSSKCVFWRRGGSRATSFGKWCVACRTTMTRAEIPDTGGGLTLVRNGGGAILFAALHYPCQRSSNLSASYPMKIHEYQGKEILSRFGVPVPKGIPAFSVDEAVAAAQKLGGPVWVVKAQIHAGGRGKGGGVKVAKSLDDVKRLASEILGMQLKTHQTGPEGQKVRRLYIEDGADIQKEYYVSVVTDRATQKIAFIASSEGGMDIEEVAHATPEKIIKVFADPLVGLTDAQAKELADGIGMPADSTAQTVDILKKLYQCYMETDASLVEINPLNRDSKGNVLALDAKFNFDSNALFRRPDIVALRDLDEEDPAEIEASKFDLAYIQLSGNIGCLVNGAGLAMATMDTIKLFGGEPANFLDVGGGATAEKVTEAFKIMLKNPDVKGILVNIFGGIMKCDTIADGVITACKAVNLTVPLVVRMKGTNEDLGKKMLADSGLPIIAADSMAEAATKIVAAVA